MNLRSTLLPLLASSVCLLAGSASAAGPARGDACKGTLDLGGKTYHLQYAVAYGVKVFDDVGTSVIFAEQPVPTDKLAAALREGNGSDEKFFLFKPHVTVTFDKSGKVMFCNAYADNNSASVSGSRLTGELLIRDGRATGKAALAVDEDSSHKSGFSVPAFDLAVLALTPAAKPEPAKEPEVATTKQRQPGRKAAKAPPAAEAIAYTKLPLPDDATDVEYKKPVGQIRCHSAADHKTVGKALAKKLAAQGWTTDGADLAGPKSVILKRHRGEAELTIFVKPADGGGCTVTVMSKGLAWED